MRGLVSIIKNCYRLYNGISLFYEKIERNNFGKKKETSNANNDVR